MREGENKQTSTSRGDENLIRKDNKSRSDLKRFVEEEKKGRFSNYPFQELTPYHQVALLINDTLRSLSSTVREQRGRRENAKK